jgi:dTDP-4-dehydrorhamnose reductase
VKGKGMEILLIGSSGMVGSAVEDVCNRKGISCVALSHEDLDITDFDAVRAAIERNKPDTVINAAAIVGINKCELEPQRAFKVNAIAVSNLAKICEEHGITLVQPGSHAIFDGKKDTYYTEDDLPNPTSIYSTSKYIAEYFAKNICRHYYVTRLGALFGTRRTANKGFVGTLLERIKKGEEIKAADDRIESPTYAVDAAEALISLLENEKPFGIYHVANSGMVCYYDLAAKFVEILKADVNVVRAKDKDFKTLAYNPLRTPLTSVKLEPLRSWHDALLEYIATEVK